MSAKKNLFEHSEYKVKLFSHYLSIYLNIIARSEVKTIYLYDLFCGEGIYEDGGKGSPIAALEVIKNHYETNNSTCPNIKIIFNDTGISEIEPYKLKKDRVRELAETIFKPTNVEIAYLNIDYSAIVEKVIERNNKLKSNERSLMFIDPWGYKEINPLDIKRLIGNGKTEVLLFLPIYFMFRFAEKAKDKDFKGGEALRNFLGQLFGSIDNLPKCSNQYEFIYLIQDQFKKYLEIKFVDSFKIERDNSQWFSLFFFTTNTKGFLKMLESKWKLDQKHGSGFKMGDIYTLDIFDEISLTQYDKKVFNYLKLNPTATNQDLVLFGMENNFLPKHTKQVLDKLNEISKIEIISLDGQEARSYYLGNENRLVNIKLK